MLLPSTNISKLDSSGDAFITLIRLLLLVPHPVLRRITPRDNSEVLNRINFKSRFTIRSSPKMGITLCSNTDGCSAVAPALPKFRKESVKVSKVL